MSAAMEEKRLAEIRERSQKATGGPWTVKRSAGTNGVEDILSPESHVVCFGHDYDEYGFVFIEDADFIAHSRADIPDLLDEIARLRELASAAQPVAPLPDLARKFLLRWYATPPTKPTIAELEKILNEPDPRPVEIAADGSIGVGVRAKEVEMLVAFGRELASAAQPPLAEFALRCIRELQYVQCAFEACGSNQCASATGRELIAEGMALLGVSDLSQDLPTSSAQPVAPLPPRVFDFLSRINPFVCGDRCCYWCERDEPITSEGDIINTHDAEHHNRDCEFIRLLEATRAGVPSDGWVAPQDRLPDADLHEVLVHLDALHGGGYYVAYRLKSPDAWRVKANCTWCDDRHLPVDAVLHWREISAAPQAQPEVKEGK